MNVINREKLCDVLLLLLLPLALTTLSLSNLPLFVFHLLIPLQFSTLCPEIPRTDVNGSLVVSRFVIWLVNLLHSPGFSIRLCLYTKSGNQYSEIEWFSTTDSVLFVSDSSANSLESSSYDTILTYQEILETRVDNSKSNKLKEKEK